MKSFTKISSGIAAVAVCLLGTGLAANAQTTGTLTYSTADLNSMDHHMVYTWSLAGIDLTGKTLTGATLTSTNLRNWDNNSNTLFVHLLDTARTLGVSSFYDDNPNDSTVAEVDDFTNTRYHNGTDARGVAATWLVANGTADTYLGSTSRTTTPATLTYNFATYNTLSTLDAYIRNGNNVAFGLDPDCHYYSDGWTLNLTYRTNTTTNSALPEPGTLALLLPALPAIGLLRRRKK